jgi:hypothetical protein
LNIQAGLFYVFMGEKENIMEYKKAPTVRLRL